MAMNVGGAKGGPRAEINITPLVDVVLVLLIIFMVVTPMLQKGVEVELPKARSVKPGAEQSPLIVTLTADKALWVEKEQVKSEELGARVKQELALLPGRVVLLKGDRTLSFGEVRKAMDLIRKAGAEQVSLATEKAAGAPDDAAPAEGAP